MDHFNGVNETERFSNDLLNEIRKTNQLGAEQNELLKKLISLYTQKPKEPRKRTTQTRKKVQ